MAVQCIQCGNYGTGLICRSCTEQNDRDEKLLSESRQEIDRLKKENAQLREELNTKGLSMDILLLFTYKDYDFVLVVEEYRYHPESRETMDSPFEPEYVEPESGYVSLAFVPDITSFTDIEMARWANSPGAFDEVLATGTIYDLNERMLQHYKGI